ncbi:succinylglutamate desuccinylase [Modicisalibacter luteus]|uniref:Succinylglutamate desuccinylase n=1 Tax=Modicisalibacter luteus TaxID=453962 RepID=A0ABV7M043_9GAMM|nr:succinylglutamate desuccinylase [Halomonas lutea]
MLADWLGLTLDGESPATTQGRLPFGRYRIHGPGILELTPNDLHPRAHAVIVSAGIHGNETGPIELVGELLARLEAGLLRLGAPTLIILGNLPSIRAGQRFCETNLNRLFRRDLKASGNEPQRARELMAAVDAFYARHPQPRLHYDLHTAIRDSRYPRFAVDPYADTVTRAEQWRWFSAAGIQAVLHQHQHSWTFSHYSKHYHQAQAFTMELGKVHPFGANDLAALRPMRQLLEALIEGREPPGDDPDVLKYFKVEHELMRESEDFRLCFPDETPNFSEFSVGTRLSYDAKAGEFIVTEQPLAVVFPNANVELGARAALLVRTTSTPQN